MKIGFIFGLLSGLSFGIMAFLVHISSDHTPSSELVFLRAIFSLLILLPFAFKHLPMLFSKQTVFLWLRCIAGSISMLTLYWTLQHSNVGTANTLAYMAPIFVLLLSWKFFNEKISLKETISIIIAVSGIIALYYSGQRALPFIVLLVGILGSIAASIAFVSLRQAAVKFSSILLVWAFSLVMLLASFVVPGPDWTIPTRDTILAVAGVCISGLMGQLFLTQSYIHLKAPIASTLGLSALVWGVICESLYYKSIPAIGEIISYLLVILGVSLLQILHTPTLEAVKKDDPLELGI